MVSCHSPWPPSMDNGCMACTTAAFQTPWWHVMHHGRLAACHAQWPPFMLHVHLGCMHLGRLSFNTAPAMHMAACHAPWSPAMHHGFCHAPWQPAMHLGRQPCIKAIGQATWSNIIVACHALLPHAMIHDRMCFIIAV